MGYQGLQDVSGNGQIVNTLGFVGHTVSELTSQLCCCGTKAALNNMSPSGHGCVLMKLYL